MLRVIVGSLRHRAGRAVALLLGVLVATTGFIVLTGSTETARLRVTGTVAEHFRGSYDILVRPTGAQTEPERRGGLVQPNFLGGQYGGISAAQWRAVTRLPGVEVAAPVAMLGYAAVELDVVEFDITDAVDWDAQRQLIEVRPRWLADQGLTVTPASDEFVWYVYVTRRPVARPVFDEDAPLWETLRAREAVYTDGVTRRAGGCGPPNEWLVPYEITEAGEAVPICVAVAVSEPASGAVQTWPLPTVVELTGDGELRRDGWEGESPTDRLMVSVGVPRPLMLVAAIDPAQEAALVGLDQAVVVGRYLAEDEPAVPSRWAEFYDNQGVLSAPTLISAEPVVDEQVVVEARQVAWDGSLYAGQPAHRVSAELALLPRGPAAASPPVTVADGYHEFVTEAIEMLESGASGAQRHDDGSVSIEYDSGIQSLAGLGNRVRIGPLDVVEDPDGALRPRPRPVRPYPVVDDADLLGLQRPPPMSALSYDTAFRELEFTGLDKHDLGELFHTEPVGVFDPELLSGLEGLGRVPLETYALSQATGADAASRELLGDEPLRPAASTPGGYLTTPPSMLVSLGTILDHTDDPAPISAVRVRVAGVTGFDDLSRERVRVVAEQIATATGLEVDIVLGSSPAGQQVVLPAGEFGRPELRLVEDWTLKNVAGTISAEIDRKSLALFGLILVVCALFVANATAAAVRDRRRELAVLACLGWSRWRLGLAITAEVGLVGLAAGAVAAALAPLLGNLAGATVPVGRAWLAVPVALGLAVLASVVPAWRASRAHPRAAVVPAVAAPRARARFRRGVLSMAIGNLFRVPGRTAVAVLAMAVGIGGLTLLAAVTVTFHGIVTGSLLGDAVSVQVRGVDTVAVAATLLLGLVVVADVLYVNVRERASELAALRATGWSHPALGRLVTYEGVAMGALGAALGAAAGVAGAAWFAGALPGALVATAAVVATGGALLAGLAALVPALLQGRLPMAILLAED